MNQKKHNITRQRVGYIGVGAMGHGIAKNILEKGKYSLIISDLKKEPVKDLVNRGATEAQSIAELTKSSDIVFMCLSSTEAVKEVVYREDGLFNNLRKGMIVVDSTTSLPEVTESIAEDFANAGAGLVDAPLGNGPKQAEEGCLASYVGGAVEDIERIIPILECYSDTIIKTGPVGSAMKIKILNNFITVSNYAVIAEALATGLRLGIDFKTFYEVVSSSGANSQGFQRMMLWLLGGGTEKHKLGQIGIGFKDLGYYSKLADSSNATSFIGAPIYQLYQHAIAKGYADAPIPELFAILSRLNGDEISSIQQ